MTLRAAAEVDLAAIERNAARLRRELREGAELCAVVKADGYGHGAVAAARAAVAGGASRLGVATAEEAAELRRAGVGEPILVMGALSAEELPVAVAARAEVVAWDERFVADLARTVSRGFGASQTPEGGGVSALPVHVKLDSGLGRLGTRFRDRAVAVARAVAAAPELELAGLMTHFATADDDLDFAREQLSVFRAFAEEATGVATASGGRRPIRHAANSAATLRFAEAHLDMVRCGIAVYGSDPMNADPLAWGLEPALTLASYVAAIKPAAPGESAGYGRRFIAAQPTCLATLPIGYGDGVARRLTNNCDVLIGGRRYPLVGTVSMDNITADLGPEPHVGIGDRAVLIGSDGSERITAEEIAGRLGTISYEVLCAISRRVPRLYHRDGAPVT